jgi:hypothetical protein
MAGSEDRYHQWPRAAQELGLECEQRPRMPPRIFGTIRSFEVKVGVIPGGQDSPGFTHYQAHPSPVSVMGGWKFKARQADNPPIRFPQLRVSLPPPRTGGRMDPTKAFLGASDTPSRDPIATVYMYVWGRDRNRFVEHLTAERKASLWKLSRIGQPYLKNGTLSQRGRRPNCPNCS